MFLCGQITLYLWYTFDVTLKDTFDVTLQPSILLQVHYKLIDYSPASDLRFKLINWFVFSVYYFFSITCDPPDKFSVT